MGFSLFGTRCAFKSTTHYTHFRAMNVHAGNMWEYVAFLDALRRKGEADLNAVEAFGSNACPNPSRASLSRSGSILGRVFDVVKDNDFN